jgi:hypothetical protein
VHLPSVRPSLGLLGSGWLPRLRPACAASVPRAVASFCPPSQHAALIVRIVMRGHPFRDGVCDEVERVWPALENRAAIKNLASTYADLLVSVRRLRE